MPLGVMAPRPRIARSAPRCLVVLVAALAAACGDGGSAPPASVDVAAVRQEVRPIVDPTRPTRANGPAPAAAQRSLPTAVWYAPAAPPAPACRAGRCALVVLAHGLGGSTARFDAIARMLAAAGYVVAAPAFPLTHEGTPGGHIPGLTDVVEQPADLGVVIDALLEAAADRDDPLFGRIDPERIGALGHSLGGATVAAATRAACCIEPRIAAAALVAPAFILMPRLLGAPAAAGPPVLVLNGSVDPLVPPAPTRATTAGFAPPWYFVEIPGAGHSDLIEAVGDPDPPLEVSRQALVAFFDEHLGGASGATSAVLATLAAAGNGVDLAE